MEFFQALRRDPLRGSLVVLALLYALLAGLKTVADPDLGWQLATGRYIVQHHTIPSTDVLSSTARGNEWIYPPGSGVLLYEIWRLGGWTALSWLNALACMAVVALLVFPAGRLAALLAILAVPAMSYGTEPRSELFTTLLFAASFGILWRHFRGRRARLWLLPVLMALWVNLHTGFAAGIALLAGYVLLEALELPFALRRAAAIARLRRAAPWCALTALATLVNPWGYHIYPSMQRQNQAIALYGTFIGWWSPVKITSASFDQFLNLRDAAGGDWWLLLIAAIAGIICLVRRRPGPVMLLAGGAYLSLLHIRLQVLFAILVVIIVGSLPGGAAEEDAASASSPLAVLVRWTRTLQQFLARRPAQIAILAAAALLVGLRSYDLVSDRHYIVHGQVSLFGAGPSWWFPERAAQFLRREKIPGNVFNDYDLGGYLAFRIGPEYLDYADGRYIPFGADVLLRKNHLMASPPDSSDWDAEVSRRDINLAIFSLSRYGQLESAPLAAFCSSRNWRPIYLDDVSVIFLRIRPRNEPWLNRFTLDCRTARLTPPAVSSDSWRGRAALFEFYANAGSIYYVLSRDAEAAAALDRAHSLFPIDPNLHLIRGEFLEATGHPTDAEQEFRAALDLQSTDAAWLALGRLYGAQHRYPEAAACLERSAALSIHDYNRYRILGQIYLLMNSPRPALEAFDRAERRSPFEKGAAILGVEFHARLAEDRAQAWKQLGDLARATQYAEQSVQLTPQSAPRWLLLADLYAAQGNSAAADDARQHAARVTPR
jgi:tetratricopeptide (TPR) repeat protein